MVVTWMALPQGNGLPLAHLRPPFASVMDESIEWIPMRSGVRQKLWKLGLDSVNILKNETCGSLAKILEIDELEAKRIIDRIKSYSLKELPDHVLPVSVFDLINDPREKRKITTGCTELDLILGGGITAGRLTEFCGVPGIGKTQLCLQLCVNVQFPESLRGLSGSAIFIDTDGGVIQSRLLEIAGGFSNRINKEIPGANLTIDHVLRQIYYFRCNDYLELIATVHFLRDLISRDSGVKLIVVDSIATHFRYAFENLARRAKMLNAVSHLLTELAVENNIAVVLTNQMTTRIAVDEESKLIPALGVSWGHACAVRVNLHWRENSRIATVFKSPILPESDAVFTISASGIGSVEGSASDKDKMSQNSSSLTPIMSSQLSGIATDQPNETEPTSTTPNSEWPEPEFSFSSESDKNPEHQNMDQDNEDFSVEL